MALKAFCVWETSGFEDLGIESAVASLHQAGYAGIALGFSALHFEEEEIEEFTKAVSKYKLEVIVSLGNVNANTEFYSALPRVLETVFRFDPIYTVIDIPYIEDDYKQVLNGIKDKEQSVLFSNARGSRLGTPHNFISQLEGLGQIGFSADFSEWVLSTGDWLPKYEDEINMLSARSKHIDISIGTPYQKLVNDPRSPEWEDAVRAYLSWWDFIFDLSRQNGEDIRFTCGHRDAPIAQTVPFTKQPIANTWEVNIFLKELILHRYAQD